MDKQLKSEKASSFPPTCINGFITNLFNILMNNPGSLTVKMQLFVLSEKMVLVKSNV